MANPKKKRKPILQHRKKIGDAIRTYRKKQLSHKKGWLKS